MSNKQNDTLLEQLIADNEGKLKEIFLDREPHFFDEWISDLSLEEVCEMLNVKVDNGQQHYEDMKTIYE